MKTQLLALATALAFGSLMASPVRAQANRPLIPEIVDVTHATKKSAAFFHSFFMAKSRHDVDATMNHFSKSTLTYIDAPASTPRAPERLEVEMGTHTADFSLEVQGVKGFCPAAEVYAKQQIEQHTIPVLSCEGPCEDERKGVARQWRTKSSPT